MDVSAHTLILILVVAFASAIIGGMGGFGTGIILTAALAPILGIKAVVPVLALAGIIINGGRFWFYRRDFDARIVKLMLPPALVLLFLGTYLYQRLEAAHLSMAIGAVVLLAIPARRFLQSRNLHIGTSGLVMGGGLFGFLNGLASGMGVVLISLLLGAGLTGTTILATDALITIAVDVMRAILFSKFDLLSKQGMGLGIMIGLASLPGSWIASRLVHKLGATLHIVVIEVLILVGGLSIFIHGWRAL